MAVEVDIWTSLKRHKNRWDRHQKQQEELRAERRMVILSAAQSAPAKLIAGALGVHPEVVYRIIRQENGKGAQ